MKAIPILAFLAIILLIGCTTINNPLVGKWQGERFGSDVYLTFKSDGTGVYEIGTILGQNAGIAESFRYTLIDDDYIKYITNTEGIELEKTYTYKVDTNSLVFDGVKFTRIK